MSFTTINYEEPNPKTYESVEVHGFDDKIKKKFNSGDFVKDWYNHNKFIAENLVDDPFHTGSSSINHFIMDGAKFDSAYVKVIDGKAVLEYEYDYENPGQEFFVKKGTTPTWDELKEMCK